MMPAPTTAAAPTEAETPLLDPACVALAPDAFGTLCLTLAGVPRGPVRPVRAFPLTDPHRWIFLLDAEDREIGILADCAALDETVRAALEAELDLDYFSTRITRILSVRARHGVTTWDVETDRGAKTLHVKDRGDIRHLSGGHLLFVDVYGMKYDIPDVAQLDPRSRDFIETDT